MKKKTFTISAGYTPLATGLRLYEQNYLLVVISSLAYLTKEQW